MGFTQIHGEDFAETFAGVVIGKTFRIMLSILVSNPQNNMEHWDVRMAFTQAKLEEELYMEQPEGFARDEKKLVCRLHKSLYGLKQSARNWQLMLNSIFRATHFNSLHADPCVFMRREKDTWCICCTHVDDIFVLFNPEGKFFRDELFEKIRRVSKSRTLVSLLGSENEHFTR